MKKHFIATAILCAVLLGCGPTVKNDAPQQDETTYENTEIIQQEVIDSIVSKIEEVNEEIKKAAENLDQALNDL